MINIYHLKVGDRGRIVKIHAGKTLRARLKSFGIYPGVAFRIRAFSLGKNNVELEVGSTLVALRKGEMEKIEVEKIENEKA